MVSQATPTSFVDNPETAGALGYSQDETGTWVGWVCPRIIPGVTLPCYRIQILVLYMALLDMCEGVNRWVEFSSHAYSVEVLLCI